MKRDCYAPLVARNDNISTILKEEGYNVDKAYNGEEAIKTPIKSVAKKLKVYRFLDKPFDLNTVVKVLNNAPAKKSGRVDPDVSSGNL